MDIKGSIILLYARPYSVKNENGSMNEGITVQYYPDSSLSGYVEGEAKGRKVIDEVLPKECSQELIVVPGLYEASFTMSAMKNDRGQDKAMLKIKDLHYLSTYPSNQSSQEKAK